jgi:hypothetical protein
MRCLKCRLQRLEGKHIKNSGQITLSFIRKYDNPDFYYLANDYGWKGHGFKPGKEEVYTQEQIQQKTDALEAQGYNIQLVFITFIREKA